MANTSIEWQKQVLELEQLSQQGKAILAAQRIRRFKLNTIPRRYAGPIASVARRIGLPNLAIRILNPIVRPIGAPTGGTEAERVVYSAALIRIGASEEALPILSAIDPKKSPDALLFMNHALVSRWRYAEAVPVLERYLNVMTEHTYEHIVGTLNLAAAHVHEKHFEAASPLLEYLRRETLDRGLLGFYGNAMELSAQLALEMEQWTQAKSLLDEAEEILSIKGGLDLFFVNKLRALVQLMETRNAEARKAVAAIQKRAEELGHWETIRDCDLALALAFSDAKLLTHLYYGTPHDSFRKRIFRDFEKPIDIPDHYEWCLRSAQSVRVCELLVQEDSSLERLGETGCRLFAALSSDFYRPLRVAFLHAIAYPGEFYNPNSSPSRIHHGIAAVREVLSHEGIIIENVKQGYRISADSVSAIRIPKRQPEWRMDVHVLKKLRNRFPAGFTAREASDYLNVERRTVARLLKAATEKGDIKTEGCSSHTRYCFVRDTR